MPEPKYVIAMGACTITGGMFSTDSYSTVRGVDKLIPVDIYLPGCPPKPEAIIDAIIKLRKKVSQEISADRSKLNTKWRCYTLVHSFKTIRIICSKPLDQCRDKQTVNILSEANQTLMVDIMSDLCIGQLEKENIND